MNWSMRSFRVMCVASKMGAKPMRRRLLAPFGRQIEARALSSTGGAEFNLLTLHISIRLRRRDARNPHSNAHEGAVFLKQTLAPQHRCDSVPGLSITAIAALFLRLMSALSENKSTLHHDKPLEYFIAAATNPYISDDERSQLTAVLCEKIGSDLEGAVVAVKNLSHKILSPDQSEALIALNILDQCVRNCGQRVWNEVAKFRFLNQFVRLLSPKYMGLETSDTVKNRAIELLFTWKNSMRHLGKIEEVYALLKDQGVIQEDPVVAMEIPNCPKPSRLAFFEDEEKAHLLSELLKSKNPDDLQAANRLIKSMVRSEDLRMERVTKRRECMEKAEGCCRVLSEMLDEYSMFSKSDQGVKKELYEELLQLRPMMFRYAGEAAESDDDALADVLSVNDVINKTIQRYKTVIGKNESAPQRNGASNDCSEEIAEEISNQLDLIGLSNVSRAPGTANQSSLGHVELDDDALIGLSIASSPAVGKKQAEQKSQDQKEHKPKSSLDELLGNLVEKAFSSKSDEVNRPSHLTVSGGPTTTSPSSTDPFSPMGSMDVSPAIRSSGLDNVSLDLTDVLLDHARSPLIVFDNSNVKIVLYFGECSRLSSRMHPFVACATNNNCYELNNIRLTLASSTPAVESRLLPAEKDKLHAFSPLLAQQNICQILLLDVDTLLPKQNITMRFAFCYAANGLQHDYDGEFLIKM
uniref:VHS domain-containing protein n=1 Tax=Steinernema glaseri TaxID=37863 RepID=A0A1I7ZAM1_9BILA